MRKKLTLAAIDNAKPRERPYDLRDAEVPGLLLCVRPTGLRSWFFERGWGGSRRVKIGTYPAMTLKLARTRAAELLHASEQGVRPGEAQPSARKIPRLGQFIEDTYRPSFELHHRTGKHLNTLEQCRDLYPLRLDRVTKDEVRRWRDRRLQAGRSPATVNRNVAALKACLSHAVDLGILPAHPLARLPRLKVDQDHRVRYLSPDEEKRLRGALDAREARIREERRSANAWRAERGYEPLPFLDNLPFADYLKPAVLVSLNTGLRQGELFDMKWERVGTAVEVEARTAKSRRTRFVPLNAEARSVLDGWREMGPGTGYVFPGRSGGRMDNIRRSWEAVLEAAELVDFRWHDLRHTFASKLVMRGVALNTVRELLGHSDLKMTLRYAHLAPDHTQAAVELLGDG